MHPEYIFTDQKTAVESLPSIEKAHPGVKFRVNPCVVKVFI